MKKGTKKKNTWTTRRPKNVYPITVQLFADKQPSGKITYRMRYYDTVEQKYLFSKRIENIISYVSNDEGKNAAIEKADSEQALFNQKLREMGGNDLFAGYQLYIRDLKKAQAPKEETDFRAFYLYIMDRKKKSTQDQYKRGMQWFNRFAGTGSITFERLKTKKFAEDYKAYLLREMAAIPRTEYQIRWGISYLGTARNYFAQLLHIIKEAQTEGKIPYYAVKRIPRYDNPKPPLTDKELRRLWETPVENQDVKNSFMLSARSTGTRISDTRRLRWGNLQLRSDGLYFHINMKKTNKLVHNELNTQVIDSILSKRGRNSELVFPDLPKADQTINDQLKRWMKRAGIDTRISTHTGRVTRGANLYKMTGNLKIVAKALGTTLEVANISYSYLDESILNKATSAGDGLCDY